MKDLQAFIDKPVNPRTADAPDLQVLENYLRDKIQMPPSPCILLQFPGGYSNLTYQLECGNLKWILRTAPKGADIKSAHDMGREYRVLRALKPVYPKVPEAVWYCDDKTVIGQPFFLMEKMDGIILRNRIPAGLEITEATMHALSDAAIDNLADLHAIDIDLAGLNLLGKPEGYVQRQVEGWIHRYHAAKTAQLPDMERTADWMLSNLPVEGVPAFIHNDYKYDNLVLNPDNLAEIIGVLDWEMATVGDPLMDLGTSLAYWAEAEDSPALKQFNLTWLPGNLNRMEVVQRYASRRGIAEPEMLFYFVFGSFKVAVIAQQIYARYTKGLTSDPRFSQLHHVVSACAHNAISAIRLGRISGLNH